MLRNILALVAFTFIASPLDAQQTEPTFDPIAFELRFSASEDRKALLEDTIADIAASPNPDLQVYVDLNGLLINELEAIGALTDALRLAVQLAEFALRQGSEIGIDPLSQLALATRLAEAAGDVQTAVQLKEREFVYRRDGGQSATALAQVREEAATMARRMGATQEADRLMAAAQSIRNAPDATGTRSNGDEGGFRTVEVFYATDRARTGQSEPSQMYGGGRGQLEYGSLVVTIPNVHVAGAIEAPSIWRLEFSENPARHVILKSVTPLGSDKFFSTMQDRMNARDRKEAFVFIHGFNVRFEGAAKRAAQLAHDMNYRGVPVLYSWPSAGKTINYVADTAVVRLSGRRLAGFLEDLSERSGADVIHIVAHSMGNRALTDALELMAARRSDKELETPLFGQVFFAAPDVDAGLFTEMTRTIRPLAERLTLYTSEQDWALVTSRKLHGNSPRAGQAGDTLLQEPHFDTVDMSDLGDDMLAHSYFANDSSALMDIMALVWRNTDPAQRCGLRSLQSGATASAQAWVYRKGECDVPRIMGLIGSVWQNNDVDPAQIRELISSYVSDPAQAAVLEERIFAILGRD